MLMGLDTPPGTKERDTLTVYAIDDEGNALGHDRARPPTGCGSGFRTRHRSTSVATRMPVGRRLPAAGGRLFVAAIGDSLEVFAYRVGDDSAVPSRSPVAPAGRA